MVYRLYIGNLFYPTHNVSMANVYKTNFGGRQIINWRPQDNA